MDWVSIISMIIGALTGGSFMFLLNPKAAKRKPEIDNKAIEATTKQTEMQSYADAFRAMQETIKSQESRNRELFEMNAKAHEEINGLKSDLMQCSNALCINSLCPLREPEKGFGDEVFARCKENNESLFNNKEFSEIAREKGYDVRKIGTLSITKSDENKEISESGE